MNVYVASLKGVRPQNEDNHVTIINLDDKDKTKKNINFYAVFDGHGGKQVSNYLEKNLPKFFTDKRVQYPVSKKYVVNAYDHIQKTLMEYNFAHYQGSTSLVVIHYKHNDDDYLNVINSGDSRCVLCRDNFAMPLTKDHKPNWPEEYYRIMGLGGKIEFDGFDWRIKDLSVSRAFGDADAAPYVTHRPDLFRYKLDKNDRFLVISCDGLVDVLSNSDIINFVLMNCYDSTLTNRINKNVNIAKKLAEYALKRGSSDNVSVIVVFFD
ncbi:protein phosphatase 2c family protein [Fadolivirus algeromassiliense]|jgi:protein phosphatase 2C|uniref:Protein phosphatase 2c family protein n=1 Tax=Fadolivirus FV1/VV64 TaxID=3070911 RepID=A0A7D3QWW8_9VIRU|nr:protein phosphatase 2c family protein [Fadolivirus algeromassiliense]QKF93840.1 protein phosphatase 2c family protein [Fadolivirus FV1/VV64]